MKRVLLLGGGHSHIEVVRQFGARPVPDTEITLVDAERFATYSGMLPGLIAGHYDFHDCHIDLARLAQRAGAHFVQARASNIDTVRRQLALNNGDALAYDLLSIDVGSTPPTAAIPGAADHVITVKPFAAFAQQWDRIVDRARGAQMRKIVVVGGGTAGVEILLAMHYRLAQPDVSEPTRFTLVSDAHCILPDHNANTRSLFEHLLSERGIEVRLNSRAVRAEADELVLADDNRIASNATIWATGAAASAWLGETGIALDARGFISIDEHLKSVSHADVYAAGDCATMVGCDYPKSGVYAVRQGPVLAKNLRNALAGQPLANYRPQRLALALISSGGKHAIASYGRIAFGGAWVWRWKNHIDRKFVNHYRADD
jgi:selenide,water dikinase